MSETSWCTKGGARGYITTRPVWWWIGKKDSGWLLVIPTGREFESSVPRWLTWAFSPNDPFFLKSAVIHDALLEDGFRLAFADSQWFEAAMAEHAPPLKTGAAYAGMLGRRALRWLLGR